MLQFFSSRCNDTTNSSNKVMIYLGEKPLHFEGCDAAGLCDWKYVKDKYKETMLNCDPDICRLIGFSSLTSTLFILIWFITLLTIGSYFRRLLMLFYSSSILLYRRFRSRFNYKIPLVHLLRQLGRGRYTRLPNQQVVWRKNPSTMYQYSMAFMGRGVDGRQGIF